MIPWFFRANLLSQEDPVIEQKFWSQGDTNLIKRWVVVLAVYPNEPRFTTFGEIIDRKANNCRHWTLIAFERHSGKSSLIDLVLLFFDATLSVTFFSLDVKTSVGIISLKPNNSSFITWTSAIILRPTRKKLWLTFIGNDFGVCIFTALTLRDCHSLIYWNS